MPVVLVAQEVPAPDEITEAWVIAHDWILNRVLLDDSFRADARSYLANKSVGDDFALRELRKNLRQQRNLVDDAADRVLELPAVRPRTSTRALERADRANGSTRSTRSVPTAAGSDVGRLLRRRRAQDPEVAKARELAAKDAHQYAVEKAEKVAPALQRRRSTPCTR